MIHIGESNYLQFLRGDADALESMLHTYARSLVRFACRYVKNETLAEEIMEDSFAAIFMKARKIHSEEQLRAYLYQTVRNKCLDHLRRHRQTIPLGDAEYVPSDENLQQDYLRQERNQTIYACMQRLSADYREVLQLAFFDGFSVQGICEVMGKSAKQVYNLMARAKASLRDLLEKEGIGYEDLS